MPRKKKGDHHKDEMYYQSLLQNSNIQAYLLTIRKGEGTLGDKGYYVHFNGGLINRLDVMPPHTVYTAVHKKKNGDPETVASSAVGAYQFLNSDEHPYWDDRANRFGWQDILPIHQNIAALSKIDDRGALKDILNGDIIRAFARTSNIWASLPGATYNQPTQKLADALSFYKDQGGILNNESLETLSKSPKQKHYAKLQANGKAAVSPPLVSVRNNTDIVDKGVHLAIKYTPLGIIGWSLKPGMTMIGNVVDKIKAMHGQEQYTQARNGNPTSRPIKNVNEKRQSDNLEKRETILPPILSQDEIMTDIFQNYPGIKNKWNKTRTWEKGETLYDTYSPALTTTASMKLEHGILFTTTARQKQRDTLPPTARSLFERVGNKRLHNASTHDGRIFQLTNHENGWSNQGSDEPGVITGKTININLNAPMIGSFSISSNDTAIGLNDLRHKVEEVLLEVLNSANAIH